MHTKLLKLTNGDNLIVTTDSSCQDFKQQQAISVIDPVLISTLKFNRGPYIVETYTMQPWIKIAKKDIINIPTEHIIVAVDIHEDDEQQYKNFVEDTETEDKTLVSDKEAVENMVDQLMEDEEEEFEEIDDDRRQKRSQTTFH